MRSADTDDVPKMRNHKSVPFGAGKEQRLTHGDKVVKKKVMHNGNFGGFLGNSESKFRVGMKIGDEDAENENPEFASARIPKIQTKRLTRLQTKPSNAAEEIYQVDKKISEQEKLNCAELPNSDNNFTMEPSGSHKVPATPVKIKTDAVLDRNFSEAGDNFT